MRCVCVGAPVVCVRPGCLCGVLCARCGICTECTCMGFSGRVDEINLRKTSSTGRTYTMRRNWLTKLERQYVHSLLDEAVEHVKTRDMKSCAAFVQHAIKSRLMSTSRMRPEVINKVAKDGFRLLQRMLNRHAAYTNLPPCPLRGEALHRKASTVGLVQRTNTLRVDVSTLRDVRRLVGTTP